MENIFLNKYVRRFKRYFIISILFYLIVSNDLVLGKGGGKGGKSGGSKGGKSEGGSSGGGGDVGTSKNKSSSSDKTSSTSYTSSSSGNSSKSTSWVFFYNSGNGQRYCGNLCVLTAVLIPIIILLIIGCGIWKCCRIRKKNKEEKKNKIEADESNSYSSDSTPNYSSTVAPYSHSQLPFNYDYNLGDNYTNYANEHNKLSPLSTELNQVKSSSRRESFDSMDEVRKK
ncbi:hypothetical protein RclHR1_22970001 [Rhizophagus clarus]|uniref:Uncharacterized protein n=1 Tax=Rhizophagus clarus TaxID=94130 RepID=A0A2Z6QV07_9GLOM|nr:hypothetical protein RclHR1_22970001 [Rhizophagus clarus]GES92138.1 hypothetical protein GLOIN_2v1591992 [Rhizophagus clarus]